MDLFVYSTGKVSMLYKAVVSGEGKHWDKMITQYSCKLPAWTDEAFMADKFHK